MATVSVVMIAVEAASAEGASSPSAAAAASTPASTASRGSCLPISPVEQTATSRGAQPECLGRLLGGGVGGLEALGTRAGVRPAGVEDDGAQPPGGQHLLRPQHRRGLDLVAGEHAGGRVRRAVVDDQGEVEGAGGLEPGRHAGGAEPLGRRHASRCHSRQRQAGGLRQSQGQVHRLHGASGGALGEVVDRGDGDEPPGVGIDGDLQVDGVRPERGGRGAATCPSGSRCTKGSSAYAFAYASTTSAADASVRAVQVARMPRGSGARTGVKLTPTVLPATTDRFWAISGVCRWAPPTP